MLDFGADPTGQLDSTAALRTALAAASAEGAGTVFLPAGWYRIDSHLHVPGNVELRGCLSCTRELEGLSAGTVLMAYEGNGTLRPASASALIALEGDNCGVRGLRVFYPENNPDFGIRPFPYTIRGSHKDMYVVDVGLSGLPAD